MGARLSGAGQGGATISQNADINVTPFVDVMLVLLIIFMVSAPLATVSLKLDLPPAVLTEPVSPELVYVSVQRAGGLYIGAQETTLERLSADVCARIGGDHCTDRRIFIRAEADVPYDRFITVMNRLQGDGFHQIGLLNEDIE